MGQKVNPNGMRIGINKDWSSRWYAKKQDFSKYLVVDMQIRNYFEKHYGGADEKNDAGLSRVDIERIKGTVTVLVHVARPGVIIGQEGNTIKKIREDLLKITQLKDIKVSIVEIDNPDLDATLVAKSISRQLENRASFRIVQKKAIKNVLQAGAKGCKTMVKGRLGGAEIARAEEYRDGTLSLQTLSQNIDYGFAEAHTTYGRLGVKVWISIPENLKNIKTNSGDRNRRQDRSRRPFRGQRRDLAKAPTPEDKKGE